MTRPRSGHLATCGIALLLSLSLSAAGGERRGADAGLRVGQLRVDKVLFLGNSITLHGPAEHLGWSGNWGMAASQADKDYVHLLIARLKDAAQGEPQVMVSNVADFERQYATFDVATGLRKAIELEADVILIAVGENVPALATPDDQTAYQNAFVKLLTALRRTPQQVIFVRSTFWAEPIRNQCMAAACRQTGDVFIDLSGLDSDEGNFARSERDFEHAGVAGHPGDKGMQAIADGIWRAIKQRAAGENWPEFRGPTADGHSAASGLPLTWSETKNIAWKTPVHDYGWSSPVVWDNQVWLTTATEDGKQLFAVCLDCDSGKILHDVKVFDVEKPEHVASVNSYASPTPAIEAGRVYVHYGTYGTACLDTQSGQVLWTRRDLNCDHHEGPGSSPILFENLLIVHVDGRDVQYVVALDKLSGKTVWKTPRSIDYSQFSDNTRKAFCTPTVIDLGTRKELISPGAKAVMAYDPRTGEELWKVRYDGWSMVPRPLFGHGLVFVVNDFERPELWAIRPGGQGDVTDSHVTWQIRQGVPAQPSLLLIDDFLYAVTDMGVAACIEAKTGNIIWRNRLGGNFAASPLYVDGRIYCFAQDGTTTVLGPGPEFKVLAVNPLEGEVKASPAVAGRGLLVRTRTHLYRLQEQSDEVP
ncbi:MAG: outer membrane protein assembly factor BamB family protein [Pirellulaceae bacterium]